MNAREIIKKHGGKVIDHYSLISNWGYIVMREDATYYDVRRWANCYGSDIGWGVDFMASRGGEEDKEWRAGKIGHAPAEAYQESCAGYRAMKGQITGQMSIEHFLPRVPQPGDWYDEGSFCLGEPISFDDIQPGMLIWANKSTVCLLKNWSKPNGETGGSCMTEPDRESCTTGDIGTRAARSIGG